MFRVKINGLVFTLTADEMVKALAGAKGKIDVLDVL